MEVHDLTFLKLAEVTKQHEIIQTILALVENAVFVPDPPSPPITVRSWRHHGLFADILYTHNS